MKAVVYDKKASPDRLVFGSVEKPTPNDDQVLVKVYLTSINALDYRSMKMGSIPKRKIFGADISGIVESIGKNITQFKVGDEVIGDLSDSGLGGFAEYALAQEKTLVVKPANVSFETAAALPVASTTALNGLRNKGNIKPGQKVLIVGSAGGVGTFAVQLAKLFEADVTAVCSTRNIEQSLKLGANQCIDYTKEDFLKRPERYDLIIAVNGNYPLLAYKRILNKNGTYVMIGGSLKQIMKSIFFGKLLSIGSKSMRSLSMKANQEDLRFITEQAANGKIISAIEKEYPLEKVAEAMSYVAEGHARAKVIIRVK